MLTILFLFIKQRIEKIFRRYKILFSFYPKKKKSGYPDRRREMKRENVYPLFQLWNVSNKCKWSVVEKETHRYALSQISYRRFIYNTVAIVSDPASHNGIVRATYLGKLAPRRKRLLHAAPACLFPARLSRCACVCIRLCMRGRGNDQYWPWKFQRFDRF